jgi:hypothetical protein
VGEPIRSSRDPSLLKDVTLPRIGQRAMSMLSHVEAKVAAMIRRGQAAGRSVLVINNSDGPCGWGMRRAGTSRFGSSCDELLPEILPAGSVLSVVWRDADGVQHRQDYRGTGGGIKE